MGVFKWLRRERITVASCTSVTDASPPLQSPEATNSATKLGTIRTEEYKRDLAEFQSRRTKDILDTPMKKSRRSLPCTDCTTNSPDKTFNYERKSALKYRKNKERRSQSDYGEKGHELPNVQFLFQNQVFMPGNMFPTSYSDPQKRRKRTPQQRSPEFLTQTHLEFENDEPPSSPLFYKNNSLPYDVKNFLKDGDSLDGKDRRNSSSQSDEVDSKNKFGSCEENLKEVMTELKNFDRWADDQLRLQSLNTTRSDGNKSDSSVYGLPVVDISDLDLSGDKQSQWNSGKWGVVSVRIKKMTAVSMDSIKRKQNVEIEILKKFRHPNIVLLMGLYPDAQQNLYLICEYFVDTLYDILHVKPLEHSVLDLLCWRWAFQNIYLENLAYTRHAGQTAWRGFDGSILTVQKSVDYCADIASALLFLKMQGIVHTELNSSKVVITQHDAAKLADLSSCVKYMRHKKPRDKYCLEPQYVNIEETRNSSSEIQPLISQSNSEVYLASCAVKRPYYLYKHSEHYRWVAPELFLPDDDHNVHPCSKSDVYSLSLILWECCNAEIPWKRQTYATLKEIYLHKTNIGLPHNGTYPGALLELLEMGLDQNRMERTNLNTMAERLMVVKDTLKVLPDMIIPKRLKRKKMINNNSWNSTSPSDSDIQSSISQNHEAMVHKNQSTTESEKETQANDDTYQHYEQIKHVEKCYISDDESFIEMPNLEFLKLQDNPSSACSTPISKITSKIKNMETLNLHRSDSTEYCSILSPNRTNLVHTDASDNHNSTTKFSKSFTPKSYKPLHIKVPEFNNLEGLKSLRKDRNESKSSTYSFDIKNYSLPNTPIARSNKLRKNAWLSGEFSGHDNTQKGIHDAQHQECYFPQKHDNTDSLQLNMSNNGENHMQNFEKIGDNFQDVAPRFELGGQMNNRFEPWPYGNLERSQSIRCGIDDEVLSRMSVKPLVAIHERWIHEANRNNERSMSLPEDNRNPALLKPASHRVAALQHSLPLLHRRCSNEYRSAVFNAVAKQGSQSEQFCETRDAIRRLTSSRDLASDVSNTATNHSKLSEYQNKTDQATDTMSIEEFIKDLIRKEFNQLIDEVAEDTSSNPSNENFIEKGTAKVVDALRSSNEEGSGPLDELEIQSFSRIKINGNNKPLLQITFSSNGDNCVKVLDNCVNVTICDSKCLERSGEDKMADTSLKRCQAFNALQEARSTEDLYIDDDISTQLQENFGGKVKLIPLHGSLHELLCDKEDQCCLIKVKQENGCDTIYFRCDNSDTESRDAIDGHHAVHNAVHHAGHHDTVLYKRSFSLIEERIQRVKPRNNKHKSEKTRPKSENYEKLNKDSKILSNSTPSLSRNDDLEVNLEKMTYQDSSSDECVRCEAENEEFMILERKMEENGEFEILERKIEEDLKVNSLSNFPCGCLEKISEENLLLLTEDGEDDNHAGIQQSTY